ncbi:hypothetical protein [Flintibacter muris]|uniref:hypothetical protein n=1 Tax=Flintibacter muris TaxID=2941327 RepID=UPI002040E82D|nr:hypothetical protein [Flintibacter muris]
MNNKMPRTPFSLPLSGSAREAEIRIRNIMSGPKKRPPLPFLILMFSLCIFCGNIVSCQMAEPDAPALPDISASLPEIPDISLPDPPEQKPEIQEHQVVLQDEDADLDGDGLADTVTATTRFDPQDESCSTIITLTAALGRGETVERQWTEEGWLGIGDLMAGYLTSPDRDALVLELYFPTSNYGAAETHILELIDGELTERYRTENASTISGAYLTGREDSPLCDVRIPLLVDKWHDPEYYTLSWNGTGWDFVGDGYFTDAETVTVTGGRVLTLALRGRVTGEQFSPHLIYDQIQVFDGDMMFNPNKLLQTILPEDIPGDDRFPDQIFVADNPSHVWIQDINFDGAEDFAVLCDSTRNQGCRWFRWNEGQGRFEYAFSLAGEVEVVPQGQHLIEACWTEDWENKLYNIYSFNNRGWLILESTWDTMVEAQNACQEDF